MCFRYSFCVCKNMKEKKKPKEQIVVYQALI